LPAALFEIRLSPNAGNKRRNREQSRFFEEHPAYTTRYVFTMETALQQLDHLLSDGWTGVSKDYYNQHKSDPLCLLQLCGQRVRADAVRHFLKESYHQGSRELVLYQDPESGITALHVALHRNSWCVTEIVRLLLEAAPELAGMPMTHGSVYPLHVACAHLGGDGDGNRRDESKKDLLRILLQACPAKVVNAVTDCGSTPLMMLLAVKNHSKRHPPQPTRNVIALIEPAMQLAQAALGWKESDPITWYSLCSIHHCPAELIELLLFLKKKNETCSPATHRIHGSFHSPDPVTGDWPLHAAARHGDDALVQLVLQQAPTVASRYNGQGRLPLHVAAAALNLQESLVTLARAHPSGLSCLDPVTGLYPFMAAASIHHKVQTSFELLQLEPTGFKS
jgi:Ankyrin repeat